MTSNVHDVARKIVIPFCRIWLLRYKNNNNNNNNKKQNKKNKQKNKTKQNKTHTQKKKNNNKKQKKQQKNKKKTNKKTMLLQMTQNIYSYIIKGILHWYRGILSLFGITTYAHKLASFDIPTWDNILLENSELH